MLQVQLKVRIGVTYPGVDLALEVLDHGGDVVGDDRSELSSVCNGRHPAGELRVPEEGVSSHKLAIALGKRNHGIRVGKGELAAGSLGGIPLHAVFRGELPKVGLDDIGVLRNIKEARVGNGAVVLFALGDEQLVDAGSGALLNERRRSSQRGDQEDEERFHDELSFKRMNSKYNKKRVVPGASSRIG